MHLNPMVAIEVHALRAASGAGAARRAAEPSQNETRSPTPGWPPPMTSLMWKKASGRLSSRKTNACGPQLADDRTLDELWLVSCSQKGYEEPLCSSLIATTSGEKFAVQAAFKTHLERCHGRLHTVKFGGHRMLSAWPLSLASSRILFGPRSGR
jgi:hypothetical protein